MNLGEINIADFLNNLKQQTTNKSNMIKKSTKEIYHNVRCGVTIELSRVRDSITHALTTLSKKAQEKLGNELKGKRR